MKALVIGGADCIWRDVAALEAMLGHEWDGLVIAANDVGVHWPRRLDHLVSLHAEKLARWREERVKAGRTDRVETWGRSSYKSVDHAFRPWPGGSSGMYAVTVALHLRCTRIVLCGVPMTKDPHFAESKVHPVGKRWTQADAHWRAWRKPENLGRMRGKVRSMSGRTRMLLGGPTPSWLDGGTTFEWGEIAA